MKKLTGSKKVNTMKEKGTLWQRWRSRQGSLFILERRKLLDKYRMMLTGNLDQQKTIPECMILFTSTNQISKVKSLISFT